MPTALEVYPIIGLLFIFLFTGWVVMQRYPLIEDDQLRDIQVDGLRPLLAFGVMAIHYFGIQQLTFTNEFPTRSTTNIVSLLGPWSVSVFFGITAYLFSQRLVGSDNQHGTKVLRFLIGRFFRLVPTSMLACLLFLLANTKVYTDSRDLQLLIRNWKALLNAALSSIHAAPYGPDNQLLEPWAWHIACGAHWTLHFEWLFYLSLAAVSCVSYKKRAVIVSAIIVIIMMFYMEGARSFILDWDYKTWAFFPGLLLGLTRKYWKDNRYLCHPLTAALAITAILVTAFYDKLKVKIPANTLFLAVILSNNTATRLLESKLLRSLGETTYSIYLLHGIVQYITLKWIVTIQITRSMPEYLWWLTCALQVVVIVVFARLSFEFVEKPGIEAGKRFYSWLMNLIERRAKWLLNWI